MDTPTQNIFQLAAAAPVGRSVSASRSVSHVMVGATLVRFAGDFGLVPSRLEVVRRVPAALMGRSRPGNASVHLFDPSEFTTGGEAA